MSKRQKLINSVIHILDHNRDGSYRTRHDRQQSLLKILNDLYTAGYQLEHVRFIKPKHIWHMAELWKNKISIGAIKNRLSHLRWLLGKLNKETMVPSNERLGIPNRCYSNSGVRPRWCNVLSVNLDLV